MMAIRVALATFRWMAEERQPARGLVQSGPPRDKEPARDVMPVPNSCATALEMPGPNPATTMVFIIL